MLEWAAMVLRIVVFLLVIGAMAAAYLWYRRKMADMVVDSTERALPGGRLTAERLADLKNPPWRLVFEVNGSALGSVDHVIVGPTGVIAVETLMVDRPTPSTRDTNPNHAEVVAQSAIARSEVDELTRRVGVPCDLLARVYWGTPTPDRPAAEPITDGAVAVEGQRLVEWLMARPPGPLSTAQVDQVWQAILTGIGRPDPLA